MTHSISDVYCKINRKISFVIRQVRLRHKYKNRKGLPPRLGKDLINRIAEKIYRSPVKTAEYQSLSGWKKYGGYRVRTTLRDGSRRTFIYKYSKYSTKNLPALSGLPVNVGLPEYLIYNTNVPPFANWLPETYWSHRSGDEFQFIQEDLSGDGYVPLSQRKMMHDEHFLPMVISALNNLHKDVLTSFGNKEDLIQYDEVYMGKILAYAHQSLKIFHAEDGDPAVGNVLKLWPDIQRIFIETGSSGFPPGIIHGDFNVSNIHYNKEHEQPFKVVDWEWAGVGLPHSDLAALVKDPHDNNLIPCLRILSEPYKQYAFAQHLTWMYWALMNRAILDASYMIRQYHFTKHRSRFDLHNFITDAVERLLSSYDLLSKSDKQMITANTNLN